MKYSVELLSEARLQLRNIAVYHKAKVGPKSARLITNRILTKLEKLADSPEMGVTPPSKLAADAGYRMLIVKDCLCFYTLVEDTVYVSHIVHGSTDYMKILLK